MGFQTRLVLSFSSVVLLGLAGSGFASYHLAANLLRDNVVGGLQAQIREVETLIAVTQKENLDRLGLLMDGWHPVIEKSVRIDASKASPREIENQISHEKTTADVPALFIDGKTDASHAFVDGIARDAGVASTLFVRVPQGFVRVSTSVHRKDGSRAAGTFIPNDSPVARALSEGRRFNARAQVVGDWYSTAYEPLRQDGRVVGAFFLGLPDTSTASIRHHLKEKKLFETGYYFILDGAGTMEMHPTLEGRNVLGQRSADGKEIFREILDRKSGTLEYQWDDARTGARQTKLAPFHHLPEVDWYVAASINQSEALAPLRELKWILLTVGGAVSLLAMGAALWFGRSVARRLTAVSDQIESAFHHVDESAGRFVAQSESLAEASTQQAAGLQETVSAVEEIRATVQKNLDQARAAAAGAVETDAKARHGSEVLEALAASVEQIAGGNREMRDMIGKNDERMKRIFDVFAGVETKTQLINEIVFQTKLLSFNASVEAARAGEHGKGFSVVAEEIGRLAAQSGQAAEEIRTTLENSHAEVEGLIAENRSSLHTLIDQSSARVETGVRTADDARRTFREIIERIGDANASVQEISRASNEQTQGVHEIARAMQEIDKATQQNSVSAVQIKEMSGQLSEDSRSAGGAVAQLREFLRGSKGATPGTGARVLLFPTGTGKKAA